MCYRFSSPFVHAVHGVHDINRLCILSAQKARQRLDRRLKSAYITTREKAWGKTSRNPVGIDDSKILLLNKKRYGQFLADAGHQCYWKLFLTVH